MGSNVKGKRCIKRAANDLKFLGAKFTIKPVQQLKTDSTMVFLGIPITADPSIVKELVDDVKEPTHNNIRFQAEHRIMIDTLNRTTLSAVGQC